MTPLIERLQKLIAHERSSRKIGNQAEAEAFATLIQTLLTKHKLTMSEVEFAAQDVVDPIGHEGVAFAGRSTPTWQLYLSSAIARNFFCDSAITAGKNRVMFIGRDSDRRAAVDMYTYLVSLAVSLAKQETEKFMSRPQITEWTEKNSRLPGMKKLVDKALKQASAKYHSSFLIGFTTAIFKRLDATRTELTHDASEHSNSLILRDQAAIADYMADRFETKRRKRTPDFDNDHGFAAGHQQGKSVALSSAPALQESN